MKAKYTPCDASRCSMLALPLEMITRVLSTLEVPTIFGLRRISTEFRTIVDDVVHWPKYAKKSLEKLSKCMWSVLDDIYYVPVDFFGIPHPLITSNRMTLSMYKENPFPRNRTECKELLMVHSFFRRFSKLSRVELQVGVEGVVGPFYAKLGEGLLDHPIIILARAYTGTGWWTLYDNNSAVELWPKGFLGEEILNEGDKDINEFIAFLKSMRSCGVFKSIHLLHADMKRQTSDVPWCNEFLYGVTQTGLIFGLGLLEQKY